MDRRNKNFQLGLKFGSVRKFEIGLREGLVEDLFDIGFFSVSCHGKFAHQKVAGALQHFFLAKRQTLGFFKDQEALQHCRYFQQRSCTHAVGIFFEAVFPVSCAVAISVGKIFQDFLNFAVSNYAAQPNRTHAVKWDGNLKIAGFDIEEIVLFNLLSQGAAADLLDNSHPVVWIHDPVTDMEIAANVKIHTQNSPRGTVSLYLKG